MHVDGISIAPLQDGVGGVTQTLEAMAALVRRDSQDLLLREQALRLVQDCPGHAFKCEINAIFKFCRDGITYRRDPVEQERVQDAKRTIFVFGSGDCDDKVVCLATLLACLGHRPRFKVLGTRAGHFSHVYIEVHTRDRGWIALDPTPETARVGWEARGTQTATYEIFKEDKGLSPLLLLGAAALAYFLLR